MASDGFQDKAKKAFEDAKDKIEEGVEAIKDKVEDVTQSDRFEEGTDRVLDGAAGLANKVTGGRHAEKIDDIRDDVDARVGRDDTADPAESGADPTVEATIEIEPVVEDEQP
ncbi:MAG TPA: hypothetical protein VFC82_00375 [Actinomycetaceae bacterium]|nr:hypothetical protein [Actinomycetaceae bacterium]